MNHPIHFVSLGPGDPELITLKGLKTLQKADIIYCPATQGKHGIISRATDILKAIEVDESLIHPFILPMSKERTDALNAYIKNISEQGAPEKWRRSEWKKATGAEVQNKELWKMYLEEAEKHETEFRFCASNDYQGLLREELT